ncbi:MAG: chromosome condensation protein CrcB [Acidimicrobiaceae bacterium]|nr:chromosome condensation protein CrcB [Acidimicrobiaceae bacterium]
MTPPDLLAVVAGALVGAPARFLVDRAVTARAGSRLPWGTMLVNASGSLVLGVVAGAAIRWRLDPALVALLGTGFCGAYTTFSSWAYESIRLADSGAVVRAAANVLGSVLVGLAVAGAGLALALHA